MSTKQSQAAEDSRVSKAAPLPDKSAVGVARFIYSVSFYH